MKSYEQKSWAKAPASKPCQSLIFWKYFSDHTITDSKHYRKDNVRNTNPVKDMPGKGINSRIGICQPQPVSKKNIRWIEKITRQSIWPAALINDSGPHAALNISTGLRGGNGTSAPPPLHECGNNASNQPNECSKTITSAVRWSLFKYIHIYPACTIMLYTSSGVFIKQGKCKELYCFV